MPEVIKLVNATSLDNGLTDIADAIRTKGGTSADLTFPNGFVSAVEAIPTGGGSGYATGTFTPESRVASVTFDSGLTTIHGIVIVPTSESPFKSNGRTLGGIIITPECFYQHVSLPSNQTGSGAQTWHWVTNSTSFTQQGTVITVTIAAPGTYGYFETISHTWFAW